MKKHQPISVVISLGGSLIAPDGIDVDYLKAFRKLIVRLTKNGGRFVIVTGGGRLNRQYNGWANEIARVSSTDLDWIGIATTKLHAQFVRGIFGNLAHRELIDDPSKTPKSKSPIIIGGGFRPGCSTDHATVIIAEKLGIRTIINLTDTKFVYDRDPKKFKNARPLKQVTWSVYRKLIPKKWTPRLSTPFDPVASKLAEKYKLQVCIVKGQDLTELNNAIIGRKFMGTLIS